MEGRDREEARGGGEGEEPERNETYAILYVGSESASLRLSSVCAPKNG